LLHRARDRTDFLDDVDLVLAERGEDHVKFGLFFSGSGRSRGTTGGRDGNRSGGGDAPLFFKHLREFRRLEHGESREVVYDLGEISHFLLPVCSVSVRTQSRMRLQCACLPA